MWQAIELRLPSKQGKTRCYKGKGYSMRAGVPVQDFIVVQGYFRLECWMGYHIIKVRTLCKKQ